MGIVGPINCFVYHSNADRILQRDERKTSLTMGTLATWSFVYRIIQTVVQHDHFPIAVIVDLHDGIRGCFAPIHDLLVHIQNKAGDVSSLICQYK